MIGQGILSGLRETARNAIGSFFFRDRLTTREYPEEKTQLKENYRNFPFLVFDGTDPMAGLRCVSCKICEKECPPQCIRIVQGRDEKGKLVKHPEVFDIDIAVCMSCGICVEACPFEAIKMDHVFEIAVQDRFAGLVENKHDLAKSNEYFHGIKPTEAAEVDAQLAEEQRVAEEKRQAAAAKAAAPPPAKSGEPPAPSP